MEDNKSKIMHDLEIKFWKLWILIKIDQYCVLEKLENLFIRFD